MIRDHTTLPKSGLIDALKASEYTFYLTGSRFMGGERPDSDWDFLTQDGSKVYKYLTSIGFESHWLESDYMAEDRPYCQTAEVLQYCDGPLTIQVQLAKDVELQLAVRDTIAEHAFERHLAADREKRMLMWDGIARGLLGE